MIDLQKVKGWWDNGSNLCERVYVMPTFSPVTEEVWWPESEGVIGVVGLAPWSTLEFLRSLYRQVKAERDWHYPRVVADLNSKIPSRGRYFDYGEEDPSPYIAATIGELARSGATVAVVPCNTAHIWVDRWGKDSPIPVINIIDEALKHVARNRADRIVILSSDTLSNSGFYRDQSSIYGLRPEFLSEESLATVSRLISHVKSSGQIPPEEKLAMNNLVKEIVSKSPDSVVLGCTELSQIQSDLLEKGLNVVDSNSILAARALEHVLV